MQTQQSAELAPTAAGLGHQDGVEMPPAAAAMDVHSKKGWDFFTKFLLWNVVTIGVVLLFIGLLTVWR